MAEKSPLVFVDGGFSQLPPGDSIEGVALGSLVAGSGLVGGGDLNTGSKRLDVGLAPNPSGIIYVGDALGLDGVDLATANTALEYSIGGLEVSVPALVSGSVAQSEANTALATCNSALEAAVNFVGSSSLTFTAASAVASGYAVGLDDGGKVQSVRSALTDNSNPMSFPSAAVVFESAITAGKSVTYDPDTNQIVIAYKDQGNSSYGTAIVGTISGTSVSFGTAVVFESASTNYISSVYDTLNNRIVVAYSDGGNSDYGTAIVGTVSGTSISFGSAVVFEPANPNILSTSYDSTSNRIVIAYQDGGNSNYGTAIVGTVSGTSISFGTAVVFESATSRYFAAVYDSVNNRTVIAYSDQGNSFYGTAVVGTISGTSISFGTAVVFESARADWVSAVYDSYNNKVVVIYDDFGNSDYGTAVVGTVSGTSISFGAAVVFESAATYEISSSFDYTSNRVVVAYYDAGNSGYGTAVVGTVSGTSISFGTASIFESASTVNISTAYAFSNNRIVITYTDGGNSNYGTAIVADALLSTSYIPTISSQNNFIGIAQATVASGTDVSVLLPRAIDFNQTGLSPGYFYYVDPTTSGFTTASGQPAAWSGAYNWGPVGRAVSSSGLLLLNPM